VRADASSGMFSRAVGRALASRLSPMPTKPNQPTKTKSFALSDSNLTASNGLSTSQLDIGASLSSGLPVPLLILKSASTGRLYQFSIHNSK